MLSLAFQGGTALRFLYQLPRFSEDLGFSLERQPDTDDFWGDIDSISTQLEHEGYRVTIKGAVLATSLIRYRELFLNLQHQDKASLLAGKVHAVLQRPYLKGRDLYDLIWYLSDRTWPNPNFQMLNDALTQSDWEGNQLNEANWKPVLLEHWDEDKLTQARMDVRPFLARPDDLTLMTYHNLGALLS